jgi:lipopolysaccharide transport system ATP-binding protein
VGTGFHPELTGRENIYLNGAILGMRRTEIDHRFGEIVAFAEIERFIDTPVKHYSSGMYLRLAFAVAAHLEPEILLIDEVLAVGDAAFQKKCLGKMDSVAKEGRTILFVSHNMGAITQLCEWTLWLDDGRLKLAGPSSDVVAAYLSSGVEGHATWQSSSPPSDDAEVHLKSACLLSTEGVPSAVVDCGSPFKIAITYDVVAPIRNLSVAYLILDAQGRIVFESMDTDMSEWRGVVREPGRYLATGTVPAHLLKPGRYHVTVVLFVEHVKVIESQEGVLTFDVSEVGYRLNLGRQGFVCPVLDWEIERIDATGRDASIEV